MERTWSRRFLGEYMAIGNEEYCTMLYKRLYAGISTLYLCTVPYDDVGKCEYVILTYKGLLPCFRNYPDEG